MDQNRILYLFVWTLERTVTVYFTQISLYVNIYVVIYLPNNVLATGAGAVFQRTCPWLHQRKV